MSKQSRYPRLRTPAQRCCTFDWTPGDTVTVTLTYGDTVWEANGVVIEPSDPTAKEKYAPALGPLSFTAKLELLEYTSAAVQLLKWPLPRDPLGGEN